MPDFFSPAVTVIDCGAAHVAVGRFVRSRGRIRLEALAQREFAADQPASEWCGGVQQALVALCGRFPKSRNVVLVVPGHLTLTKFVATPRLTAAQEAKVVGFEAQQNIPYALTDVVWDYVRTAETDRLRDVMLCAAKVDAIERLCAAAASAGFRPRFVVPSSLALLNAFRSAAPQTPRTLLVEIGARTTTLLLREGGRVHLRAMPLGGQDITRQLAAGRTCEATEAEAWKRAPRPADPIAPAAAAFATRLAQEITRTGLHFQRQSGAAAPERVLLSGGAARLAGLPELLASRLNVPVERGEPLAHIEVAPAAAPDANEHALALSALCGAAETRLKRDSLKLDLLAPSLRRRTSNRRRQRGLTAAAVLAAAALVPPLWHCRTLEAELRRQAAAVEAEIAPLRAHDVAIRASLARLEQLQTQIAGWQSVHDRRASWPSLFADLQERLGRVEDVWFERLQILPAGADAPAPLRLAISGRLLDRTNPLAKASPDTYRRVTTLLGSLAESPFVGAVESERFDHRQPGILRFDFVLVGRNERPL